MVDIVSIVFSQFMMNRRVSYIQAISDCPLGGMEQKKQLNAISVQV